MSLRLTNKSFTITTPPGLRACVGAYVRMTKCLAGRKSDAIFAPTGARAAKLLSAPARWQKQTI